MQKFLIRNETLNFRFSHPLAKKSSQELRDQLRGKKMQKSIFFDNGCIMNFSSGKIVRAESSIRFFKEDKKKNWKFSTV